MAEEKKATEILAGMDQKIDEILGYVKNIDHKYNLILDRLNSQTKTPAPSVPPPPRNSAPSLPPSGRPGLPSVEATDDFKFHDHDVKSNLKSKLEKALADANQTQEELDQPQVDSNLDGMKRTLRFYPDAQIRRIPVQQRISYADGKNVPMASVEVFDASDALVKQTKTNQQGKWMAALPAGEYRISVSKMPTNLKPKVEATFQVTVLNSDSVVELETKKV